MDKYLVNAVVNFCRFASVSVEIALVRPEAVRESGSVSSSYLLCALSPTSASSCCMIVATSLEQGLGWRESQQSVDLRSWIARFDPYNWSTYTIDVVKELGSQNGIPRPFVTC